MWFFIMALTFGSVATISRLLIPPVADRMIAFNKRRSEDLADKMGQMFIRVRINRIVVAYTLAPLVLATVGFLMLPGELRLPGVILGLVLGFLGPSVAVKILTARRQTKFEDQLVDTLMILSSSLKGGLSLIQALEVVSEEMPDPMSQETGILLGENKMGVSLEEAFGRLLQRMPSTPLHQMITAILLARETGGNLPVIFSRIVTTIRENRKIKQNLDNLTLQGKIQGTIMSLLPIAFAMVVFTTNRGFFNIMLNTETGKMLLIYAAVSECIGAYLIWKISSFKEF